MARAVERLCKEDENLVFSGTYGNAAPCAGSSIGCRRTTATKIWWWTWRRPPWPRIREGGHAHRAAALQLPLRVPGRPHRRQEDSIARLALFQVVFLHRPRPTLPPKPTGPADRLLRDSRLNAEDTDAYDLIPLNPSDAAAKRRQGTAALSVPPPGCMVIEQAAALLPVVVSLPCQAGRRSITLRWTRAAAN